MFNLRRTHTAVCEVREIKKLLIRSVKLLKSFQAPHDVVCYFSEYSTRVNVDYSRVDDRFVNEMVNGFA